MEKKVEHVGWTLKGRCREVAVSVDDDLVSAIIYGETIKAGRWFYTLPYTKSGGTIEEPQKANIERNGNIIGWDTGNAELGAFLSKSISEDYEMMRTIQNVVQHMELVEDVSVNHMIPGKLYGFEEEGYCDLVVSCLSKDKIYFLRFAQDNSEYSFANEEDEKVDCWPMEYVQELLKYKTEDYEYDTRTLRGLHNYAYEEIFNLPEKYVDFENKELVTVMEFSERVNLQFSDIARTEEKKVR